MSRDKTSLAALQFLARAVYPNNRAAQRVLVDDWMKREERPEEQESDDAE